MAKFEITYTVTKTQTYVVTISAKDIDDAETKFQARLDALPSFDVAKYHGVLADGISTDVEFDIEDIYEI